MTREEQISIAACAYGARGSSIDFEAGVKWADEHPKPAWISIVDDLPCNHNELLESPNDITKYVLAMNETGLPRITYMEKFNNKWLWRGNFITHWMPIPKFE